MAPCFGRYLSMPSVAGPGVDPFGEVRLGDFAGIPQVAGIPVRLVSRASVVRRWLRTERRWLWLPLMSLFLILRVRSSLWLGGLALSSVWGYAAWYWWRSWKWTQIAFSGRTVVMRAACPEVVVQALEQHSKGSVPKGRQYLNMHLLVDGVGETEAVIDWERGPSLLKTSRSIVANLPTPNHVWRLYATRSGGVVGAEIASEAGLVQVPAARGRIGKLTL